MDYPKVKDFLYHVVTGTNVVIEDDITEGYVYYEGRLGNYFKSDVANENLTLIQSFIKDNVFHIKAIKNYEYR